MDSLPDDCVSKILSYTSPHDACRFSMVSSTLRSAADSDLLWQSFCPSDYRRILSRVLHPHTLDSSSYKHLFCSLCHPLLLDGGNMSFKLEKSSGKKSYIQSARQLSITWSSDPLYWCWRTVPESRLKEVAELRMVSWLEIRGEIWTRILTPNTWYAVYLIMKISHREYGLDRVACEVSVAVGEKVQSGKVYLCEKDEKKGKKGRVLKMEEEEVMGVAAKREDGWMEIKVGEFFSGENDEHVTMSLMEEGYQLKGGLVVEGIEVRPKHHHS
ncbi:F-box protein PP2-B15-like [Vigna umbellata]|uniref:F-box protein PP2-B15-like n=1 Tax=Vigna umbellata TaxID=87088 RepID=UPI001F5F1DAA|nr:F-box protein PP2-B15-like [Vigna umbellata]